MRQYEGILNGDWTTKRLKLKYLIYLVLNVITRDIQRSIPNCLPFYKLRSFFNQGKLLNLNLALKVNFEDKSFSLKYESNKVYT